MKLGFCGLGNMGRPMAVRLLRAGHELVVWNRTGGRTQELERIGATVADTPAAAAAGAEAVVTMLTDGDALDAVVHGDRGAASGLARGSALIDMSTVGPEAIRSVASRLPAGIDVLDAPVKGGPARAARGELRILVGGAEETFRRFGPVFAPLGTATLLGPLGTAAAAKLVNNFAVITLVTALGEAIALADAIGLDEAVALDVLAASPLAATVDRQWKRATGEVPASFRLHLAEKDLALAVHADRRRRLALGAQALAWLRAATRGGMEADDLAAVIRVIRTH